jgi:carbon starvation protein
MNILLPVVAAVICFVIALRFYPRWIARNFSEDDNNPPPSEKLADGRDYVKSRTHVVFAHHFSAIAGAGPIVGPTLAIVFGWQPVWLWIVLGGIFFGAVHDMSVMFISMREEGRTIAEIARRTLGPVGYVLNLLVLIFVLTIVNAIFITLSVTALTSTYPVSLLHLDPSQTLLRTLTVGGVLHAKIGGIATTSVLIITAFAPLLGYMIHRRGLAIRWAYIIAAAVCVASIVVGFWAPVSLSGSTWLWVMTVYVFLASAIPVWLLLQPRDFVNVQILYGGMLLLFVSILIGGFTGAHIVAPPVDVATGTEAAKGFLWPILFITVACGAISGFHSLVASGTTVKQVPRESDVKRIGYGGMILESFLAILVIAAVGSMLPHGEYMNLVYPADPGVRSNPVLAFALAAGRIIHLAIPFIPISISVVIGILLLEGFVVTTLDAAVRLCRLLIEEFWRFVYAGNPPAVMRAPHFNSAIAVALMLVFALNSMLKQMWPIFGAGNQLIGALALTSVSVWLVQRARHTLYAVMPATFMVITTIAALFIQIRNNFAPGGNLLLGFAACGLLFLSVGVVVVGVSRFAQAVQAPGKLAEEPAIGGK